MVQAATLRVIFVLHLMSGCRSLLWKTGLENGARIVRCEGQEVSLPWNYSLEPQDQLVGISWSHRVADKETTLGTYALETFSTNDNRISLVEKAGIKLSDVQPSDSGTYIVNVRLSGRGGVFTRNVSLLVAEPPKTQSERLEAMVNDFAVNATSEGQGAEVSGEDRLLCGRFTDLGSPPAAVVWETPDKQLLPSTGYDAGYFFLDLSQNSGAGNYHCLLNRTSTAVSCLPDDAALRDKVVVGVLKQSSSSAAASLSGGAVAGIIIAVLLLIAVVIVVSVIIVLRKRKGKSYAPKEPDSPGPEDEESSKPFKT